MIEKIKKLLHYQIAEKITEDQLCEQIGISRQTFFNLKRDRLKNKANDHTIELIDNFILEKEL